MDEALADVDDSVSPLGAALIQALQEAGEDPSELIGQDGDQSEEKE
jgi:hypothetical protein